MKNPRTEQKQKEELLYAIRIKSDDDVKQFILDGVDPNTRDNHRTTVLMHAAKNGWEDVVELLLKKGADPNMQNLDNETALKKAISYDKDKNISYNICNMLIDAKADPNLIEYTQYSPLIWAVFGKQEKIVDLLLENGANPDTQTSVIKKTALMFAAYQGYENITKALLDKKAGLNIQSRNDSTALLDAIGQGHFNLAKILLKAGADPNLIGGDSDSRTPLMAAIAAHDLETVKILIDEYGADINIVNNRGWTATSYAISARDKSEFLEEIAKHRPRANQPDDTGYTDIMRAVMMNEHKKIDLLLKQKPAINLQNNKGETALIRAVHLLKEPEETVRKLLEHGADPNIKDNNGQTALDIFMGLERDNETLVVLLTKGHAQIKAEENKQIEQTKSTRRKQLRNYIKENARIMKH